MEINFVDKVQLNQWLMREEKKSSSFDDFDYEEYLCTREWSYLLQKCYKQNYNSYVQYENSFEKYQKCVNNNHIKITIINTI